MKIFAVRIGTKYGSEYETYLEERLPEYDFHWISVLRESQLDDSKHSNPFELFCFLRWIRYTLSGNNIIFNVANVKFW